jgi:hypothetical protein
MQRTTISLTDDTYSAISALADGLGCSRSALVEVILARSLLPHLKARLDFMRMSSPDDKPIKRYRGDSIREIEELIDYLETNAQGELWDAIDQR